MVQLSIKTEGRHETRLNWESSFLARRETGSSQGKSRLNLYLKDPSADVEPSADVARQLGGWCSLAFKVWLPDSRHLLL